MEFYLLEVGVVLWGEGGGYHIVISCGARIASFNTVSVSQNVEVRP